LSKTEEIIEETQREAIINRPYNLAGSIKRVKKDRFNISQNKIEWSESNTVPALLKLFMESLDNPIDVAIKGGCNQIDIKVDEKSIRVKDNGYGVSTEIQGGESVLYKAFCKYNTSSNYQEKKGQGQKGVNGIGIKLCTTLSTIFEVTSEDSNGKLKITATDNNLNHKIKELKKTGKTGVEVYFEPDFNIFEIDFIDEEHINKMYEYTLMQALTYPEINFKFNGKSLKIKPKQFIKLLSEDAIIEEQDDYFFAIVPSESGEFRQLSYINGLEISKGGSHIDYIVDTVVKNLRTKILRKYKNIKPSDIKNKINIIVIGKNMKNIDWEGQVKDTIASSPSNIRKYFEKSDLDKFSDKVYKNKTIIDCIIDFFRIAEEYKKNQELAKMDKKTSKKPKDEKFLAPVGSWDNILLAEGDCLEENTKLLDKNFKPKSIKDFKEGDYIISGDCTLQKVTSFRKSLKRMNKIKTSSGEFLCSDEHRWYVYNKREKVFEFLRTDIIKEDIKNYSFVKSRINNKTTTLKVINNIDKVLKCDTGEITYTNNDFMLINRDNMFLRIKASEIHSNDILIFG
jgi:DNA topoisomerase-2